jgi:hypothetical protein
MKTGPVGIHISQDDDADRGAQIRPAGHSTLGRKSIAKVFRYWRVSLLHTRAVNAGANQVIHKNAPAATHVQYRPGLSHILDGERSELLDW